MEKRLSAIKKDGKVFLEPGGRTDAWLWIELDPLRILDEEIPDEKLGIAFLETLKNSRIDVPDPVDLNGPGKMATAAGYKSWSAFAKGALSVSVSSKDGQIEFGPSKWGGTKEGHLPLPEETFTVSEKVTPLEMGAALKKAFDLCK